LIGPNGAGKSTLLRTLAGEQSCLRGSFTWQPNNRRHRGIAWLPQSASLSATAPISVRELAAMGLWGRLGLFGRPCSHDQERIEQALETVGLIDQQRQLVNTLSGGQLQRALFARLAVQDCGLILLDEPFSAVDTASQDQLLAMIQQWTREGRTVIAALHDLDCARRFPTWWEMTRFGAILHGGDHQPLTRAGHNRDHAVTEPVDSMGGLAPSA
jgi:zinc/manganese transport system ATP-binding protein